MQRLLIALLAVVGVMLLVGCKGSGRGYGRVTDDFVIFFEWSEGDVYPAYLPCGYVEIDGRVFIQFCDAEGRLVYLVPVDAPDRVVPARELEGLEGEQLENGRYFEHDGRTYVIMALPRRLLEQSFDGPAGKLLVGHGVEIEGRGWTTAWSGAIDEGAGIADLRFAATRGFGLPDPFAHDLRYETVFVPGDGPDGDPFVYQRVVGQIEEVNAYVAALLGPDGSFEVETLGR